MFFEDFKFEEKENYTYEEVQAIVNEINTIAGNELSSKMEETNEEIAGLRKQAESITELEKSNKDLSIKHLALQNGIGEDMLDLIKDDDLEVVNVKIAKLKELTKKQDIDNSYKPENKRKDDDDYSKAEKSNDVEGMLKSKLGRLFG